MWGPLIVAAAQLDEWSFGQFMWSRPIVLGPVLGWALGHMDSGVLVGVVVEVLSQDRLPVGEAMVPSAAVSAGLSALLAAGGGLQLGMAIPAGLLAGWLHLRLIELPLRRRRDGFVGRLEAQLSGGTSAGLGRCISGEVGLQFAATAGFCAVFLIGGGAVFSGIWRQAPEALRLGLEWAVWGAGFAGLGMLFHALRDRG